MPEWAAERNRSKGPHVLRYRPSRQDSQMYAGEKAQRPHRRAGKNLGNYRQTQLKQSLPRRFPALCSVESPGIPPPAISAVS